MARAFSDPAPTQVPDKCGERVIQGITKALQHYKCVMKKQVRSAVDAFGKTAHAGMNHQFIDHAPAHRIVQSHRLRPEELGIEVTLDDFDQIARAEEFTMPILLFHGTEDDLVPASSTEEFARALPDLVTYYSVPRAGHVESWNVGPRLYESRVRRFLKQNLGH